jgi:hypothetical protein
MVRQVVARTLLKAQGPSRTCDESREEDGDPAVFNQVLNLGRVVSHPLGEVRRFRWAWFSEVLRDHIGTT